MSDWFHSIPMALDTIAFAAKARVQPISFNTHITNSHISFNKKPWGHRYAIIDPGTSNNEC